MAWITTKLPGWERWVRSTFWTLVIITSVFWTFACMLAANGASLTHVEWNLGLLIAVEGGNFSTLMLLPFSLWVGWWSKQMRRVGIGVFVFALLLLMVFNPAQT